jgi:leader peptidase (prepilin peptidase)/N-methyltransferase
MGLAFGNYACSLIHRLPRKLSLLGDAPYCGTCKASLQVQDLFPVISAMLLRHRCRYCGTPFPISHTITELLVTALFVLMFLQYNFTDTGVLFAAIGVFLIILATIEINEGLVLGSIMLCIIIAGALFRTLLDHTLFNFIMGGLFGAILGAIIWRKQIIKVGHIYKLPKQAELLIMAGICVGADRFLLFLIIFAGFFATFWLLARILHKKFCITTALAFSILISLL